MPTGNCFCGEATDDHRRLCDWCGAMTCLHDCITCTCGRVACGECDATIWIHPERCDQCTTDRNERILLNCDILKGLARDQNVPLARLKSRLCYNYGIDARTANSRVLCEALAKENDMCLEVFKKNLIRYKWDWFADI